MSSVDFLSSKSYFPNILSKIQPVSNSLNSDQAQHYVGPDMDPNCLQMLSTDDTSRQIVKVGVVF